MKVRLAKEYPQQEVAEHEVLMVFDGDADALKFREWWGGIGLEKFDEHCGSGAAVPERIPSVRLHDDMTVTVSGVNYDDMRSILTEASLQVNESEKEIAAKKADHAEQWLREVQDGNIASEKAWVAGQRQLIESLSAMIMKEIDRHNRER